MVPHLVSHTARDHAPLNNSLETCCPFSLSPPGLQLHSLAHSLIIIYSKTIKTRNTLAAFFLRGVLSSLYASDITRQSGKHFPNIRTLKTFTLLSTGLLMLRGKVKLKHTESKINYA